MQQFLKGKILSVVFMILVGLVFLSGVFFAVYGSMHRNASFYEKMYMFLDGEYSVDGGDWKRIDPWSYSPIRESFHTVTFRGKPIEATEGFDNVLIFSKNVWYTLYAEDGTVLKHHASVTMDEDFDEFYSHIDAEFRNEDMKNLWYETMSRYRALQYHLLQTPGYRYTSFASGQILSEDAVYTLEVINPYPSEKTSFSDCFYVVFGDDFIETIFIYDTVFWKIALLVLLCIFGMILFPAANFIFGKAQFTYFSFGILCFFWSIYMIMTVMSFYLNYWILDPVLCMTLTELSGYCFMIVLLLYFRSNMTQPSTRKATGIMVSLYTAAVAVVIVLHLTAKFDLVTVSPYMSMISGLCFMETIAMLSIEIRRFQNRNALDFLISWFPLALSVVADICTEMFLRKDSRFFMIGFAATMVLQLARIMLDIRTQYRNSIQYQKMQKELYEAKVAVMVSQIRPHFMYNALSSIAMLCKLDPDRAYTATVTFSDYLRGNMDSLKQTAPVPFSRELEHLKKYLYIEKMRFDDMLNIKYDIQTEDFDVPQLSVQPLVENAVKHGVGMKEDGGTVTIATRETETAYEIIISDDGVGFDTSASKKEDGRSHIGMENTRKRLKDMCNADIVTESTPGEGTTVRVIIPKKQRRNRNHENALCG